MVKLKFLRSGLNNLSSKKGFMHTLEMVAAIVLTFLFIIFIIPVHQPSSKVQNQDIFAAVKGNEEFRRCALQEDSACLEQLVSPILGKKFGVVISVTDDPFAKVDNLPKKEVYSESRIIVEEGKIRIIKIYYWLKES